jgi:2-octaprenyl-6-methoxyphenol hydroxylase
VYKRFMISSHDASACLLYDLAIVGGGYVGLSLAVALKQARPAANIILFDARPAQNVDEDGRSLALSPAALTMLHTLQIADDLAAHAQPITSMIITDSLTDDPVRPVFLRFEGLGTGNSHKDSSEPSDHDEGKAEAIATMVPNGLLTRLLREKAAELGVDLRMAEAIEGFEDAGDHVFFTSAADKTRYQTRLLVAADGVNSRLRQLADIPTLSWRYKQKAIVATLAHERPHHGQAVEHFLPSGPFALLPLVKNRTSIVWTEKPEVADQLINSDEDSFHEALMTRFGHHLGKVTVESGPKAFPLGLLLATRFYKGRLVLVGDAAHGIHPIAGQGLNMGLKDVAALAELLVEAWQVGLDPALGTTLSDYERWRRFDTVRMAATTDILNRLFSNDSSSLRGLRSLGLRMVERLPKLKHYFMHQATGSGPDEPLLLRGKPLS